MVAMCCRGFVSSVMDPYSAAGAVYIALTMMGICALRSLISQKPRGENARMISLKSHTRMQKSSWSTRRAIVAAVKRAQGRLRSPIKTGRKGPLFSRQLRHLIQQTSIFSKQATTWVFKKVIAYFLIPSTRFSRLRLNVFCIHVVVM